MNQLEIWLAVLAPVCCCLFASRGILHYFQLESYQFPGYFRTLKRNPVHSLLPGVCSSVAMVALLYLFDLVAVRGASAFWRIAAMILLLPVSGLTGFVIGRTFSEKHAKKAFVLTGRMKRLMVMLALVLAALGWLFQRTIEKFKEILPPERRSCYLGITTLGAHQSAIGAARLAYEKFF